MRAAPSASPPAFCRFDAGDGPRLRGLGPRVLAAQLDIPPLPPRLAADCRHEIAERLGDEPGAVEALSLARARMRWPGLRHWLEAMDRWTAGLGMPSLLAGCDMALMACRGAAFHHDGARYGGAAFCNLFLGEDRGLDVLFPQAGQRIPLRRGSAMCFDTCQPHGVVLRGASRYDPDDFAAGREREQLFLTWELPLAHAAVRAALGIALHPAGAPAPGIRPGGAEAAQVCPDSGAWRLPA